MSAPNATADPFVQFKAMQRQTWSGFAANEGLTTIAAGELVEFANVRQGETALDVACGTGVVAITAALRGARVEGLDLTPPLLERARQNASLARVDIKFTEGDAEALPYPDASFDVVLSQYGHIFAPRPEVVTAQMLRVLKPEGRIAFTTWPAETMPGQLFTVIAGNMPSPPPGAPVPAPSVQWGEPAIVRQRLGDAVTGLRFRREMMVVPALSPHHLVAYFEANIGPLQKLLTSLDQTSPDRAAAVREEVRRLMIDNTRNNTLLHPYLMSMATKKR